MYILGYSGFTRDSHLSKCIISPLAKTNQDFESLFNYREGEVPFSRFPLGYFGHDASAAIFSDGQLIASAAEERFTRVKFSLNLSGNTMLPRNAINFCLNKANINIKDVDLVTHYCDFNEFIINKRIEYLRPWFVDGEEHYVEESYNSIFNSMMSHEIVLNQFKQMAGYVPKRFFHVPHHESHAASAFYPSGFREALIFTNDGTGEIESSLIAVGKENSITEIERTFIPTSLGSLYLIITVFLGFRSLGDEYKVMGLASYGNPQKYRIFFDAVVNLLENGKYSTELLASPNLKNMIISNLGKPRKSNEPFSARDADVAAALQESINKAVLHKLKYFKKEIGIKNLCMAGGVALNCTLNGMIARSGLFNKIFIQPAANDEGCSIGAALYAYYKTINDKHKNRSKLETTFWGPRYNDQDILNELNKYREKLQWSKHNDIASETALALCEEKVVGWFQGKMEFGPRALGHRSILADPRNPQMKDRINEKVKRRESFRPFAPAVIEEEAAKYFDMTGLNGSPFMLFAVPVLNQYRNIIPAVTHVDGSARLQTVSKKNNRLFWNLISEFNKLSGIPVVLNTSFNLRNEPIVCSPKDAILCFLSTDLDCLAIGNFFVKKRLIM